MWNGGGGGGGGGDVIVRGVMSIIINDRTFTP